MVSQQKLSKFLDDEEAYALDMQMTSGEPVSGWRGYRRAIAQVARYVGHDLKIAG